MISTTFNILKDYNACEKRYKHLARKLGGIKTYGADKPITLKKILEVNGVSDAVWVLERKGGAVLLRDKPKAAAARKAYKKATAPAWKVYEKAMASAWKAYKKATAPAWKAYKKATAPAAWKVYKKATAPAAWKAYKKVMVSAWKVYEEAAHAAFLKAIRER